MYLLACAQGVHTNVCCVSVAVWWVASAVYLLQCAMGMKHVSTPVHGLPLFQIWACWHVPAFSGELLCIGVCIWPLVTRSSRKCVSLLLLIRQDRSGAIWTALCILSVGKSVCMYPYVFVGGFHVCCQCWLYVCDFGLLSLFCVCVRVCIPVNHTVSSRQHTHTNIHT
jgi:hypothetical protein